MKRGLLLVVCVVVIAGCASVPKRHPLPQALMDRAAISGVPLARHWGDQRPVLADEWMRMSAAEIRKKFPGIYGRKHAYLAISGGGANGAFGAGLLAGWTEAGTRPIFTIVTGVSTGALMAPFVFLGSGEDAKLEELYTTTATKDLLERRGLLNRLTGDAAADSEPLQELLARYVDERMIERIAEEHRKGRRLFVGTTNLDAERPVIWDLGAIAASGDPKAPELFRQVMLASASIPVMFPPVLIEVEADGQRYDEMHVDGGVASQVFLYPIGISWRNVMRKLGVPGKPDVYIIRNAPLAPVYEEVRNKIMPIAVDAINALIRTQGIGDLYQIFLATKRDGLNYHLADIPASFTEEPTETFDPVYMRKLFDLGRKMGREGYPWAKAPPGYRP